MSSVFTVVIVYNNYGMMACAIWRFICTQRHILHSPNSSCNMNFIVHINLYIALATMPLMYNKCWRHEQKMHWHYKLKIGGILVRCTSNSWGGVMKWNLWITATQRWYRGDRKWWPLKLTLITISAASVTFKHSIVAVEDIEYA